MLSGKNVLISAGPMRTALDPVRYVQNRSSGKMGLEVARAARARGASVSVLLGPVDRAVETDFAAFKPERYVEPADYANHLERMFPRCDYFFSLAAVLDFEIIPQPKKMDREFLAIHPTLSLPLKPVPDFVASVASQKKKGQRVIAFAAETGNDEAIVERAESKRQRKGADAIIANPVRPGLGPEANNNELWILRPGLAMIHLGPASKQELAPRLLWHLFPE